MSRGIFITATGTDAGKTYVTALIVKKLAQSGLNAGYYKAALSGAICVNNKLIPGDAEYVRTTSGITQPTEQMVSYVYKNAVSPHLAAKSEGNPVEAEKVKRDFSNICNTYNYVTVEGSGGIVCPIRYEKENIIFLEDIIKLLKLPVLLIADAGLGTINYVVTSCEYIKSKNIKIQGIILNNYDETNPMHVDNKFMIEEITNIPIVATVEKNAKDINIDIDSLKKLYVEI
jgi:dethiobiotin synthetase